MPSQFWKHPRSNAALALQWRRRVNGPLPFILDEVNKRMLNRAQIFRPVEGGVVHHGWLHPSALDEVKNLFGDRTLSVCAPQAIDLLPSKQDTARRSFLSLFWPQNLDNSHLPSFHVAPVQGKLAFGDNTQAMIWSPMWLHSLEDPAQQLSEWLRILKPQGGVFFACFGPDTGKELSAFAQTLGEFWPDFADMHDIGDLMSKQGFSDPVMEMEKLTLTYSSANRLLQDWRALVGNNLAERKPGMCSRKRHAQALAVLESLRNSDTGKIALTLELIYGHAWKIKRQAKTDPVSIKVSEIGNRQAKR